MGLFSRRDETAAPSGETRVETTDTDTETRVETTDTRPRTEGIRQTASSSSRLDGDRTWRVEPVTKHVAAPGAYEVRPAMGSLSMRILLTLLGAAALIVSAFLEWFLGPSEIVGTDLTLRVFWPLGELGDTSPGFAQSAGLVAIALGALALLGLAFRMGWLTRLAGALGLVGFAMYAIRIYRTADTGLLDAIGLGAWLFLLGSIITLLGGFMGTARKVVVPEERDVVTGHRTVVEPD